MTGGIRVGVVDKHPLYRDGVVLALNAQLDIDVVAQGVSVWDALEIAQASLPDVVVLDAGTLDQSLGAVESIGILIVAETADEEQVYAALKRGVRGYLLKGTNASELVQTVRVLSQGQSYIAPSLGAKLLMRSSPVAAREVTGENRLPHLTPREQQILSILAQGRSNKEIGNKLELSEKTIKHHLTNILQKLRVRNRVEAALFVSNHMPNSLLAS